MPNVQLIYNYIKIIDYTVLINPYWSSRSFWLYKWG